jgi:glycosyltransferase involved in cell wall biosynthesis
MHIGVDATCFLNTRGYGRHARSLLGSLVGLDAENRYTFVVDSEESLAHVPSGASARLVRARSPAAVAASADGHRSLRDAWRVSRALSSSDFDVLLFPTVYSYVPVVSRARKLVVIHDVIAETYPHLTLPSVTARLLWRAKVAIGRWQADALVTVSEFSKRGILERFGVAPDQVFVVGEASDPVFRVLEPAPSAARLEALGVPSSGRHLVYVGGFGPHKNLDALVSAFAAVARRNGNSDLCLVMVGNYDREVFHSEFEMLERRAGELAERVVFTGYLEDSELVALLNLATALVLPSMMEGFGLPAVEAAACGCPVIATSASPLPEILGEGALYVDPHEPEELERALDRLLASEELRAQMRVAGRAAASRLTWDAAARQLLDVIHRVMDRCEGR